MFRQSVVIAGAAVRADPVRAPTAARTRLRFTVLGQRVALSCRADHCAEALHATFEGFEAFDAFGAAEPGLAHQAGPADRACEMEVPPADLAYEIEAAPSPPGALILRDGQRRELLAGGLAELLYRIEQGLVVRLQERRPDLLFLHAAALEFEQQVIVLAGESGHGKSTATWGLLHEGFTYLSDELCPLEPDSLRVHPYPHALCLKRPPPLYPLPAATIDAGSRIYVPATALPGARARHAGPPRPATALFFVRHDPARQVPRIDPLSPADAALRLYGCTLNALAHPNAGLDAVADIARRLPCFSLASAELGATSRLLADMVTRRRPAQPG